MEYEFLILGAGLSGISYSYFLESENYLILEKEKNIGGQLKTIKRGEYIWDYGGHFLHFNDKNFENFVKNSLKDNLKFIKIQ